MNEWVNLIFWYVIALNLFGVFVYLVWRQVEEKLNPKVGVPIFLGFQSILFFVPCISFYLQKQLQTLAPSQSTKTPSVLYQIFSSSTGGELQGIVRYLIPDPSSGQNLLSPSFWLLCLGICYFAIVLWFVCQTIIRYRRTIHFLQDTGRLLDIWICSKSKSTIEVFQSEYVESPFAAGILRKRIFVPVGLFTRLTQEEKKIVLHHERIHLDHQDTKMQWCAVLIQHLFFFNPIFKKLFQALRLAQEKRCDSIILATGVSETVYAKLLYKVAQWQSNDAQLVPIVAFAETSLERRIQAMFTDQFKFRSRHISSIVCGLSVLGTFALLFLPNPSLATGDFSLSKIKKLLRKSPSSNLGLRLNKHVNKYLRYYTTNKKGKTYIRKCLRNSRRYLPAIRQTLKSRKMPLDLAYLPAAESCFRPNVTSSMGAKGLWQFIKSTARRNGLVVNQAQDQRLNPHKSTVAALSLLFKLKKHFGSFGLALLAYNAGKAKVSQYIKKVGSKDVWQLIDSGKLTRENKNYIPRFYALLILMKHAKELKQL